MKCSIGDRGNLKDILNYWADKGSVWLDVELFTEYKEKILLGQNDWIENKKKVRELNFDYEAEIVSIKSTVNGISGEELIMLAVRVEGIWDRI